MWFDLGQIYEACSTSVDSLMHLFSSLGVEDIHEFISLLSFHIYFCMTTAI